MEILKGSFIWDSRKEILNVRKHGINFTKAAMTFKDDKKKLFTDSRHSEREPRYFCICKVGGMILTVRFTYRDGKIRIYGAGYWRKGKGYYEKEKI